MHQHGYMLTSLETEAEFALQSPKTTLGRGDECDISLQDDLLSRVHCVFEIKQQQLFCRDLSSTNGTKLNGKNLEQATVLQPGDVLKIGRLLLEVTLNLPDKTILLDHAALVSNHPLIESELVLTNESGERFVLAAKENNNKFALGRAASCEVNIVEVGVSNRHAGIVYKNKHWFVVDLRSTNGTFVNNNAIEKSRLYSGDVLHLGKTRLSVAIDEKQSPTESQQREGNIKNLTALLALALLAGTVLVYYLL